MKNKKIEFIPTSEITRLSVPSPRPARNYKPEWYKNMPAFNSKSPGFDSKQGTSNRTLKMCMPFLDALSSGYIQETWQEINFEYKEISNNNVEFKYYYPTVPDIIGIRSSPENHFPIPNEYHQVEFLWRPSWLPKLPQGYSAIITHPLNRIDLPFYTLTGILDSDTFYHSDKNSNMPFLLKKDFSGVIPAGTPMYQIIPFKRDSWHSESNEYNEESQIHNIQKLRRYFWSGYKKIHWNKKYYN